MINTTIIEKQHDYCRGRDLLSLCQWAHRHRLPSFEAIQRRATSEVPSTPANGGGGRLRWRHFCTHNHLGEYSHRLGWGAVIKVVGTVNLINATVSGNTAGDGSGDEGGGIYVGNATTGRVNISTGTFYGQETPPSPTNTANDAGDGIHIYSGTAALANTIVAGNNGNDDLNGNGFSETATNLIGNVDGF